MNANIQIAFINCILFSLMIVIMSAVHGIMRIPSRELINLVVIKSQLYTVL